MIDFLKGWVTNIVALVVIIVLLEMLIPGGKIKKNINMISGLVLMIAIMNPLVQLIKKPISLKDYELAGSTFINQKEIEKSSSIYKENQVKQMVEVYRQRLVGSAEEICKRVDGMADSKADVLINEDYESSEFGTVNRVYLSLSLKGVEKDKKNIPKVEKIEISDKGKTQNNVSDKSNIGISESIRKQIEEKIGTTLGVQKENIIISVLSE